MSLENTNLKKHMPRRANFERNWGCSCCGSKDSIKRISIKFEAQELEIDFEVIMVEFVVGVPFKGKKVHIPEFHLAAWGAE
jgi:hypothetical protein